ncbi:hypothetical protein PHLGIDRAFT_114552 [Phlebiopsis gigantea 11061_1 CR5-6]|uniref:SH3 domain-containing protein n=1 Tax=Phlebiopsis gigantea (strain 11061_1 CR5-6) TaxID=745531 RepID=A0A0C3SF40_PHLG1|nr:hypothetical protein PHLGIDRAFT_114552 [Phlebiopsis gigantea 11061_1 CR5-6]
MTPPPIQVFLTTIASQVTLRQRQGTSSQHSALWVKKIPFTSYDLASDEDAKKLWKRKAPRDKQQLPGLLVGGEFPGDFTAFEEAVEFKELDQFLRRNEDYKPFEDEAPLLRAQPIGVPGAYSPLQMYPKHAPSRSPSPSPLKLKEKEKSEINSGETLAEFGLANVSVSEDELRALVEELGLGGDEASDLVKGLAGPTTEVTDGAKVAPSRAEDTGSAKTVPSKTEGGEIDDVKSKSSAKDAVKENANEESGSEQKPAVVKVLPPDDATS